MTTEREFNALTSETSFAKAGDSIYHLIRFVERTFDCHNGPYQPWVMHEGEKFHYVTVGFVTLAPKQRTESLQRVSDGNAAQMLRQAMMATLLDLRMTVPKDKPGTLYWRYAPGGRFLEEIETSNRKRCAKLMTRIAVPYTDYGVQGVTAHGERYPQI